MNQTVRPGEQASFKCQVGKHLYRVIDGQILNIYLGSSPKPFCPNGRSDDLSILVHAITSAEKFIYVAVSDYAPMNVFGKIRKPWLILDDLLREGMK